MNKHNNWQIKLIALAAILILISATIGVSWSHRMELVSLEEKIEAQLTANKSNYDNMWKRFKEMTQVTDLQADQMKELYSDLIEGRYQDSSLLFKFVQESNPQLNTEVYLQLQREISAGRTEFDNNQKYIADIIREYNTAVKRYIIVSAITNRTTKNSSDYIVTSDRTNEAFATNKDDVIDLRG